MRKSVLVTVAVIRIYHTIARVEYHGYQGIAQHYAI